MSAKSSAPGSKGTILLLSVVIKELWIFQLIWDSNKQRFWPEVCSSHLYAAVRFPAGAFHASSLPFDEEHYCCVTFSQTSKDMAEEDLMNVIEERMFYVEWDQQGKDVKLSATAWA